MEMIIRDVVMNVLQEQVASREIPIDLTNGAPTVLFGKNGIFDSLGLVGFLIAAEEAIEDKINVAVSLTSDKAVSRRISPFSSVEALTQFIEEELSAQTSGVVEKTLAASIEQDRIVTWGESLTA